MRRRGIHGCALRGRLTQMAAVHVVVLAIMIDVANFGRISINATTLVLDHRVVGPVVFSQAITEIAVPCGHLVALIVSR